MRDENRVALLCESCEFSTTCTKLEPCDDYVPAKGTNFFDDKYADHVLHFSSRVQRAQ